MAKNAVGDWSTNDSLNTDVGGTNIAEGCAPGGINDAIRKVMSQIATWYASITTTVAGLMPKSGGAFTGGITGTTASFSGALTGTTASFSTSIYATASGWGSIRLTPQAATSGLMEVYSTSGSRLAYILQPTTGTGANTLLFGKDDSSGFTFLGGVVNSISGLQSNGNNVWHAGNLTPSNYAPLAGATFTGLVNATGGLQVSGNAVWHAGNFTPSNYALLSGFTTTGAIKRDTNFYLDITGSNAIVNYDANDYIYLDRTANKFYFVIGGTSVASIDASGNFKVLGNVTASAGSV